MSNYIYGPEPPIDPPDDDDLCPCGGKLYQNGDCPRCEARIAEMDSYGQ